MGGNRIAGTHDQHSLHPMNGSKRTSLSRRKKINLKCKGNPTGPLLRRCCSNFYRRSGRRRLPPHTLASPRVPLYTQTSAERESAVSVGDETGERGTGVDPKPSARPGLDPQFQSQCLTSARDRTASVRSCDEVVGVDAVVHDLRALVEAPTAVYSEFGEICRMCSQ